MNSKKHYPLIILAAVMGVNIGNMFYSQSLLPVISEGFGLSDGQVFWVPVFLQTGLLTSLFFLLPAGDIWDRRLLLRWLAFGCSASALAVVLSFNYHVVLAAFYCLGLCSLTSYMLPAYLSGLIPQSERGHALGVLLGGQFSGILLSRFFSGVLADWFGWRSIYLVSSLLMLLIAFLWPRLIPRDVESVDVPYKQLLVSQLVLIRRFVVLRCACASQGFQFAAFVTIWTGLSLHLAGSPWFFGPAQIGAFGLVGLASILSAQFVGRLVDRYGAFWVIIGCTLSTLIGVLGLFLVGSSTLGLLLCLACIDLGVQGSYVANQARVFSLDESARSRLGSLLFVSAFSASVVSGLLQVRLWPVWGWSGLLTFAVLLVLIALVTQIPLRRTSNVSLSRS